MVLAFSWAAIGLCDYCFSLLKGTGMLRPLEKMDFILGDIASEAKRKGEVGSWGEVKVGIQLMRPGIWNCVNESRLEQNCIPSDPGKRNFTWTIKWKVPAVSVCMSGQNSILEETHFPPWLAANVSDVTSWLAMRWQCKSAAKECGQAWAKDWLAERLAGRALTQEGEELSPLKQMVDGARGNRFQQNSIAI